MESGKCVARRDYILTFKLSATKNGTKKWDRFIYSFDEAF